MLTTQAEAKSEINSAFQDLISTLMQQGGDGNNLLHRLAGTATKQPELVARLNDIGAFATSADNASWILTVLKLDNNNGYTIGDLLVLYDHWNSPAHERALMALIHLLFTVSKFHPTEIDQASLFPKTHPEHFIRKMNDRSDKPLDINKAFLFLALNFDFSYELYKALALLKYSFLQLIEEMPDADKKIKAIRCAIDPGHALGKLFYTKRGSTDPNPGNGSLKKLHDMLKKLQPSHTTESKESHAIDFLTQKSCSSATDYLKQVSLWGNRVQEFTLAQDPEQHRGSANFKAA